MRLGPTQPSVFVVVGPTASGKSAYAVELARKIGAEVISADSRQVYKGLDIGTGKITRREMKGVPHHLLDVVSPKKVFTAHDYVEKSKPILEGILEKGKSVVICGGTGFYIDALLGRISVPEVPPNRELRGKLTGKSAPQLFAMLKKLDPRRAKEIDQHNPVRLIRAIEIAKALGKVPKMKMKPLTFKVEWIGMPALSEPSRGRKTAEITLRDRIHTRLLSRMKVGMLNEAKKLHEAGLSYKRMDQLGLEYRHLARLLQGKVTKEQMLEELEKDIVAYAKRQLTYWKRNAEIEWYES